LQVAVGGVVVTFVQFAVQTVPNGAPAHVAGHVARAGMLTAGAMPHTAGQQATTHPTYRLDACGCDVHMSVHASCSQQLGLSSHSQSYPHHQSHTGTNLQTILNTSSTYLQHCKCLQWGPMSAPVLLPGRQWWAPLWDLLCSPSHT